MLQLDFTDETTGCLKTHFSFNFQDDHFLKFVETKHFLNVFTQKNVMILLLAF
jgi:hypothetical protein